MKLLAVAITTAALFVAPHDAWSQEGNAMKIELTINGAPLDASLENNATARDLLELLPLTLAFRDYAAAEKIAYLPRKLTAAGAPAGFAPSAGDIAYYAPWGNLAIFYREQPYAAGLVHLGRIDSGAAAVSAGSELKVSIGSRRSRD